MSTPYQVEIAGLGKSYNGKSVLGPIDLSITAGAITAIIGRSGCGKTTLLRCLGGLEAPDHGSITIAGGNANPRDIGYVFQEPRLMPWLTVAQNIAFGLTGNKSARSAAVAEALELVGLAAAARQLPKQISGGMAQRTALALADRVIVLEGPPGIITGDFAPDLPHPADRTSSQFFTWKRRLHNMLSGRETPSEAVTSPQQAA
jgi:ABC-type nitrate/sulfonate/bicarbonate transport system ATPase subunit